MDKKSILDKLFQIDKNKYSISELGLFGSYAKDNADDNSDIDTLVKLEFKKELEKFLIGKLIWLKKELLIINLEVIMLEKIKEDKRRNTRKCYLCLSWKIMNI